MASSAKLFTKPANPRIDARRTRNLTSGAHLEAPPQKRLAAILLGALAGLLLGCSRPPPTGLHLHDAYIKTAIPGRTMTAAYATLLNHEPQRLCLVGFAADFATTIELHETRPSGGPNSNRVSMQRLPELCIEPGGSVTLKPGGKHLMVMGLTELPSENARIVLGTASGRAFEAVFAVRPFNE